MKIIIMNLQEIQNRIVEIRGLNIMLDFDLAALYEVENRTLKQAVRRNRDRFPADFMFELTEEEVDLLVSHFVIPSKSYLGGAVPFAFTEQGVAMLSSVLRSKTAIHMNIAIMRAFVLIRQYTLSYTDLTNQLKALEIRYHQQFSDVYEAINYLIQKDKQQTEQKRIGF